MKLSERIRLAARTLAHGQADETMPAGVMPQPRGTDTDPMQLSTVFRGVQVLQTAVSGLPLHEYADGRRLNAVSPIVQRPDQSRSRRDFISDLVASMVTDGNAFIHVKRFGDEVVDCRILPPSLVTVSMTNDDVASPVLVYTYRGHTYRANDIVHLKFVNMPGRLRGLGPISAAREEIEGARRARDYKARFYTDGSNLKGYLKTDTRVNKELAKEAKDAWKSTGDAGDIKVIGSNLTYVPLDMKPADLQFLETQKFDTTQIARLLGIPASIMMAAVDGSNLTYSNIEQAWKEFGNYTLLAYTGEIEEAMNQMLPLGHEVRFDWDSSSRVDMSSRYTAYKTAIDGKWLTIDEVREREGLQPLKGTGNE